MNTRTLQSTDNKTSQNLGNKVAEIIARDLLTGVYQAGDMLPKETRLAVMLSVSRASVGSGLQILAALGMIRRQAGRGTVVEESREWNLLDPLVSRWMVDYANPNSGFLQEIVEYRRAIEPYVSALAATRATARDLAEIEAAYNRMAETLEDRTSDAFSQADIDFHRAIYRATHNLLWTQSANILRPAIHLVIEKSNSTAEELTDSLGRHHRLLESIRLRQPAEAFDAAIQVLDRTAHDLNMQTGPAENELLALMKARMLPD